MNTLLRASFFAVLIAAVPGERAPTLSGTTLRGEHFALDSLRGRVVVVDFWASWCEPCRRSFPTLEGLSQRLGSRGVTVVGVSVDDEVTNYRQFAHDFRPTFPIMHDATHAIAERWSPPSMPSTYVINREGVVVAVLTGSDVSQVESRVLAALGR